VQVTGRARHYKAIFGPWWAAVNGLWTLLSSAETLVGHYASVDFKMAWDAAWIAPKWGWKVWIIGVAVSTAIFAVEYSYREIVKHNATIGNLAARLEAVDKAKPRIRLKEPGAIHIEQVAHNFTDGYSYTVPFLQIRFVNDPSEPYPSAKAPEVRAKIDYYRFEDNTHLLSIDGRWSDSDQPSGISPHASKNYLLATTFGHGEEHSLDIAYRDGETRQYFAWNNDNYNYHHFRYAHHHLRGDHFRVQIHLRGDWIDEKFSFAFRTTHNGFEIE